MNKQNEPIDVDESMLAHHIRFRWLFTIAAICDFMMVGMSIVTGEPFMVALTLIAGIGFLMMAINGWAGHRKLKDFDNVSH